MSYSLWLIKNENVLINQLSITSKNVIFGFFKLYFVPLCAVLPEICNYDTDPWTCVSLFVHTTADVTSFFYNRQYGRVRSVVPVCIGGAGRSPRRIQRPNESSVRLWRAYMPKKVRCNIFRFTLLYF